MVILALATHMKAGWVNDPQVALMTLKLPLVLNNTPTQGLKACNPLQLVRTEEASSPVA